MFCDALLPHCLDGPFSQAVILVSFPHSAVRASRMTTPAFWQPWCSASSLLFATLPVWLGKPACPEVLSNSPVIRCFAHHELSPVLLTYTIRHHRGNGYVANYFSLELLVNDR